MTLGQLRNLIVETVWPLLEPRVAKLQDLVAENKAQADRLWSLIQRLEARVDSLETGEEGSSYTPSPVLLSSTAKGSISRGDPLMDATGFPDHVSLITQDEAGVSGFIGFSNNDATDGEPVQVWTSGPCPVFSGLNTAPASPDTAEVFVFGPHPPVFASGVPSGGFAKRVGLVLDSTTVFLELGDVFKAA